MCSVQTYGGKQIVMEEDEVNAIKRFEDPGMFLIGFKPMEKLKIHHHVRQSCFLYPEEGEVKGTSVALKVFSKYYINLSVAYTNTRVDNLFDWLATKNIEGPELEHIDRVF